MTTLETLCVINNEQINNNILEINNNILNIKKTLKVIPFNNIIQNHSINDTIIKNEIHNIIGTKKSTSYFLLGKKNEKKLILNIITDLIIEYTLLNIPFSIYMHDIDFNSIYDTMRNEEIQINSDFNNTKLYVNPHNKTEVDDILSLIISRIMNKRNEYSKIIFSIENEDQRIAIYDLLEDKVNTIFLHENYYINTELYYIELYFLNSKTPELNSSKLVKLLNNEIHNNCKFILNYVNEHKFISLFDALINYYKKYSKRPAFLEPIIKPPQVLKLESQINQEQVFPLIESKVQEKEELYNNDAKQLLTQLGIYNRCLFDSIVKYHIKIQKIKKEAEPYNNYNNIKDEMCNTLIIILDKIKNL